MERERLFYQALCVCCGAGNILAKTSHIPAVFCWANADEPDDFPYFNTWTSVESIVKGTKKAKLAPHLTTAMNRLEINFGVDCDRDMDGHRAVILILGIWRPVPIDPTIVGLSEDANARRLELRTYYLQRDLADYCIGIANIVGVPSWSSGEKR